MDKRRKVARNHSQDIYHLTENNEPQFQTQEIIVQDVDSSDIANPDHSANVLDTLKSVDEDLGIKMNDQRN